MTELFRTVLNMSITGAYIAAAVFILRLLMKKLPKKYSYMLWAILGIRLLCPFSFSSAVSIFNVLIPEKPEISSGQMEYIPKDIEYAYEPQITVSVPAVSHSINEQLPPAEPPNSVNPMQIAMLAASAIWICGMAAMVIYSVLSYFSVRKRVRDAKEQNGVYICDNIETPFVFGIIKPRIYLPECISEEDMRYIVAHEQVHIRRGDHIVKLIAMAALCVHWLNPLVWISYRLMTKDMELSCDEKALGEFDDKVKKAYANALLNISMRQNKLTLGGVLSFGESNIKSRIKGVLGAKKPKVIVSVIAIIAVIIAAVCLLTNAAKKDSEFEPIPDGVYVTDKLLYTAPQKDSYFGDNNGLTYEIKGNSLVIAYAREENKIASTFTLSEPMEIPFTDEEWDEAFDTYEKIGWQYGEKDLGEYDNKYCFALLNDKDGSIDNYLFVVDGEIWYVQYGWEIYRLKIPDNDIQGKTYTYVSTVTDLEAALKFERVNGDAPLSMNITIPHDAKAEEDFIRFSANTVMKISPFVESPVDIMNVDTILTSTINDMGDTCSVIMRSPLCHEYNIDNSMRWICFIAEHNDSYSSIILFVTTDDEFTYEKAEEIVLTAKLMMYYDFSDEDGEENFTETLPNEKTNEYIALCGGYLTDLWSYIGKTGELSSEKYTSDTDMTRLMKAMKSYYKDTFASDDVTSIETVISGSNVVSGTTDGRTWLYIRSYDVLWWTGDEIANREEGYSAYFEITEENGSPEIYRGYELWFLDDELGFTQDNISPPLDIDIDDAVNAYGSSENTESAFQTVSLKHQTIIPDEYGGYNFDQNAELIDVKFAVPAEWTADGHGIFLLGEEKVLEQNVVYPDSYELMTEEFLIDMVSGREIKKIDEKYGDENDPYRYYIHTSMPSYDGVYDTHYFVIQQNGYYVTFCFIDSEDFSMAIANAILSTVTVSPVYLDINLDTMQAAASVFDIGTLQSDGTVEATGAEGAAKVSFFLPREWFITNDIPGMYYNKHIFTIQSVYLAVPDRDYSALNDKNGVFSLMGSEVEVLGESFAEQGGSSPYDYMVHKREHGSECYEYVVTRGNYSAVVHFNADTSATETVRNAIIKSIKIEKIELSETDFEGIDFSAAYDSQSKILTMSLTNNSQRKFIAVDNGIELYENGEYKAVSFLPADNSNELPMIIPEGEGLEFYKDMNKMSNPELRSGKYRAAITGHYSDAPEIRGMMYAEFEIDAA